MSLCVPPLIFVTDALIPFLLYVPVWHITLHVQLPILMFIPTVSSSLCLLSQSMQRTFYLQIGPEKRTVLLRKSEWEKTKGEWNICIAIAACAKKDEQNQVLNDATLQQGESLESSQAKVNMLMVSSMCTVPWDCLWV